MRKLLALFAICLFVSGLVATIASAGTRRREVLIGSYHCSASSTETSSWPSFDATGDIFDSSRAFYQQISSTGDPGERCEAAASEMRAVFGAACRLGPTRTRADDSGEERNFEFVCHASRSQIIATIAETTGVLLDSGL